MMRIGQSGRPFAVIAMAAGLLALAARARQQPPPPPPPAQATAADAPLPAPSAAAGVIHAESRVVRVDVIVTDKKGNYVHDLAAKDFHVYDNDKEQQIVNFSFGSAARPGSAPERRYMVLFFDDSTMDNGDQARARNAALKFIDADAGPDRVLAVVDFTGALRIIQNFTADAARLKRATEYVKTSAVSPYDSSSTPDMGQSGAPMPALFNTGNNFGVYTLLLAIRTLAKDLAAVPGRKSVVLFTEGFPLTPDAEIELTATISACNQANVAIYPLDVRGLIAPAPSGGKLFRENVPDTKPHLVLAALPQRGGTGAGGAGGRGGTPVGGGGAPVGGGTGGHGSAPVGGSGGTGGSGARATGGGGGSYNNTANSPYLFGSNPFGPTQPQMILPTLPDGGTASQSVMYALADGTGGFPILNTNDLLGGLARIAQEQDEYYFLGYAPSDAPDGSCHTLRVKTDRGGLKVRARTGYCTAKPKDMLADRPVGKELEADAKAPQAGGIAGTLEAPFFYTSPNEAFVDVSMEVPASSVQFSKDKGKYHADIDVLGIAYKPDGSVGARFSDQITYDFEKDEWKNFLNSPMHYENQFSVTPGRYTLTVVLSAGGKDFGKFESPLAIDPYDGKTFSLSAIALSNQIEPEGGLGGEVAAELLADRTPMIVQGMQLVPSGSDHFKKTDNVALYAQIYEPRLADSNPPEIRVAYRVVDVKTGKLVFEAQNIDPSASIQKGNPVVPLGLKVPLSEFPAGDYRLDMQAYDASGGLTAIRTVRFVAE